MRILFRSMVLLTAIGAVLFLSAPAVESAQEAKPQESFATARLKAYIEAFNTGDDGRMKAFLEEHFSAAALKEAPVEARIARFQRAKLGLRSFSLEKTLSESPLLASILAKAGNGDHVLLQASVEKEPPYKLVAILLERVENPDDIIVPDPKADVPELVATVRSFLDERTRADEFSGAVLIAKNDQILFHEAYGRADREKNIPNLRDTKFNLGSINKNFTRAAVYILERQGKLSLDDTIGKFLPDYPNPDAAKKVTVRHLLDMTSGIGDFFGPRYDQTPKDKIRTLRDYLPLFADQPLEFEPGTGNRYSNGGYLVLGLIIEKASGQDYYDFVRENIFKPCGMVSTDSFARDANTPNLAKGYTRDGAAGGGRVQNLATLPGRGSSAGGGYSTAEDMLKYVLALKNGSIVIPDLAGGLAIAGGAPGINSMVEWDTRTGYIVIVLGNLDPPAASGTARRIVAWLPR